MNTIEIYGEIGTDITPADIRNQLKGVDDDLTVKVDSPGGDVYAGLSILTALRSHPHNITVIIEGLAASAASFIAVGASDELIMSPNSEIMIHDAMIMAGGNAAELQRTIADLNRVSDNIASIYAAKAGGTASKWRKLMEQETWFSDQEALDIGLVDRISGKSPVNTLNYAHARAQFRYSSRAQAPQPITAKGGNIMGFINRILNQEDGQQEPIAPAFDVEQWQNMCEALALDPLTATADDFVKAVVEIATSTEEQVEQAAKAIFNKSAPRGVTIDANVWDEMKNAITTGLTAKTQEGRLQAEQVVDQGIRYGKITASHRERWIAQYLSDPAGTTRAINDRSEINRLERGYSKVEVPDRASSSGWVK